MAKLKDASSTSKHHKKTRRLILPIIAVLATIALIAMAGVAINYRSELSSAKSSLSDAQQLLSQADSDKLDLQSQAADLTKQVNDLKSQVDELTIELDSAGSSTPTLTVGDVCGHFPLITASQQARDTWMACYNKAIGG